MAEAANNELGQFTEKLKELDYEAQCRWFLNAFWQDLGDSVDEKAEEMWKCCEVIRNVVLDQAKGSDEHALDEFGAARLWEEGGEAMTRNARVAKLKKIDVDNDKRMSLWEYFIFKWNDVGGFKGKDAMWAVKEIMTRDQGTNEALIKAQKVFDLVMEKGKAYTKKTGELEQSIEDLAGKVVKVNRAKFLLEQHLANDIFKDAGFNKQFVEAKLAVKKAKKGENTTCQGDLWWGERTLKETAKFQRRGNLKR